MNDLTAEAFWERVDRNGPFPSRATGIETRCWIWMGGFHHHGGGRFKTGRKNYMARRTSWEIQHGTNPGEACMWCKCGNEACVRHLGIRDRYDAVVRYSRHYGSSHTNSVLTEDHVKDIRMLAKQGLSQRQLAESFGVSQALINTVVNRRAWRHVV